MSDVPAVSQATGMPVTRLRGSRRVVRPGAPGTDPTPQSVEDAVRAAEDTDTSWSTRSSDSNDDQLKQDVPPHWG
ncbi:hypothetical protein D9V29_06855 [Mycetocola manganoxydans]|uniref:Uncharacterized protein n=1 Tax=Mycetocola manganoxydans TaxID=699879 RepID=A0A3L6ZYD1_9MICO|nr:hypothetical protein [Mycetocola manganoxydans]RLP72142.1 hypothetical protein D9V29_06855 [Mycetocola manganoxydans]